MIFRADFRCLSFHCVGCSQEILFVFLAVARSILTCIGCSQPFLSAILGCSQVHFQLPFAPFPFLSFYLKSPPNATQMWPTCLASTTNMTIRSIPSQSWQVDGQIFTCKSIIPWFYSNINLTHFPIICTSKQVWVYPKYVGSIWKYAKMAWISWG